MSNGLGRLGARVFVRVRADLDVPWSSQDVDQWLDGQTLGLWGQLRQSIAGLAIRPVFSDLRPIESLNARVLRSQHARPTPKYGNYAFLDTLHQADVYRVRDIVRGTGWDVFATVSVHGPFRPAAAPVLPADDDEFEDQRHLRGFMEDFGDPKPGSEGHGVGARLVWRYPGGAGQSIAFADVEAGWGRKHPDLRDPADMPIVFGEQDGSGTWKEHGTAMLGVVCALDNGQGVIGIAPSLESVVLSSISEPIPGDDDGSLPSGTDADLSPGRRANVAGAIAAAVERLDDGDVLLIEVERIDEEANGSLVLPVEVDELAFEAIRDAVDAKVVVVEAAGNGALVVDGHLLTDEGGRDSGAIMVGAAYGFDPYEPYLPGNHGERIDCWGWAGQIRTTWRNGPGDFTYKDTKSTSGAAAVIAGVCASIQGMRKAYHEDPYDPDTLRGVLRSNVGTASQQADLGYLPDLKTIASSVLGLPYPFVREDVDDDGSPFPDMWGMSPDIIVVKNLLDADAAAAAFGPDADNEDEIWLGDAPERFVPCWVHVRVRNTGAGDAENVRVLLFESQPIFFATPAGARVVGEVVVPVVPAGEFAVSPPIPWTPARRFASLGTIIGISGEPPYTTDYAGYATHGRWLRFECRAIATRNLFRLSWDRERAMFKDRQVVTIPFRGGERSERPDRPGRSGSGRRAGRRRRRPWRSSLLELDLAELGDRRVWLLGPERVIGALARDGDEVERLPRPYGRFGAVARLAPGRNLRPFVWHADTTDVSELALLIDAEEPLDAPFVTISATQRTARGGLIGKMVWRLESQPSQPDPDAPDDADNAEPLA